MKITKRDHSAASMLGMKLAHEGGNIESSRLFEKTPALRQSYERGFATVRVSTGAQA